MEAWTAANFCRVLTSLKRAITPSFRRNGRCEFSDLLLNQRPQTWRSAMPMSFMAAL